MVCAPASSGDVIDHIGSGSLKLINRRFHMGNTPDRILDKRSRLPTHIKEKKPVNAPT
uniref:Uncharacterized protein n=1 Tax=Peronospora matthiolae TaxID=2874970 RepID=A0AAV1V410_9STRA